MSNCKWAVTPTWLESKLQSARNPTQYNLPHKNWQLMTSSIMTSPSISKTWWNLTECKLYEKQANECKQYIHENSRKIENLIFWVSYVSSKELTILWSFNIFLYLSYRFKVVDCLMRSLECFLTERLIQDYIFYRFNM